MIGYFSDEWLEFLNKKEGINKRNLGIFTSKIELILLVSLGSFMIDPDKIKNYSFRYMYEKEEVYNFDLNIYQESFYSNLFCSSKDNLDEFDKSFEIMTKNSKKNPKYIFNPTLFKFKSKKGGNSFELKIIPNKTFFYPRKIFKNEIILEESYTRKRVNDNSLFKNLIYRG